MNQPVAIPISKIRKARPVPKGRAVDAVARADVASLLGDAPLAPEFLIENLHKLQDRFGHLSAAHLAALAEAMKLSQAEVFKVAIFYHHFDVVKEGGSAPPRLTVRVCDTLSSRLAGAELACSSGSRSRWARTRASWPRPASAAARRRRWRWWDAIPWAPRRWMPSSRR